MSQQNILLDGEIFTWVLLPLLFILLCVGVIRNYAAIIMKGKPKRSMTDIREHQTLAYCRVLLANAQFLPSDSLLERTRRLVGERGELNKEVDSQPMANMMSDPSMMGDMMKQNLMMIVPNIAMMSLVSMFFAGFVMAKLPFALPARFKGMVQRGVDIDHLDCAYATSLSLYFIVMFGLQGILLLILGSNEGDETQMMQKQMQNPMGQQPGQPVDVAKLYKSTAEEIHFTQDNHKYALQHARKMLLQGR